MNKTIVKKESTKEFIELKTEGKEKNKKILYNNRHNSFNTHACKFKGYYISGMP